MGSTLMIQGTQSNAGKSLLVTGLCRLLSQRGFKVAPFKPQNMSLNSAVTIEGGEIGRAQALQAQACGLQASNLMNPVLLKPNSDKGSQVIIQGQVIGNMTAEKYHQFKPKAFDSMMSSHHALTKKYDLILAEGAGSPAEINLRKHDIANMGFAEAVDCPVVLIATIDPGGVFAQVIGTLEILSQSEKVRIKGIVINQFRGDIKLLKPGIDWLQQKTNIPVLGVLPFLSELYLDAEDSMDLNRQGLSGKNASFHVIVPALPRISNHSDFEPLRSHPEINLKFCHQPGTGADLIVLPGSKNVIADLQWLQQQGWEQWIKKHLRFGGKLIGICGGFQMLGESISDDHGMETIPGNYRALNLLPMTSQLTKDKTMRLTQGEWTIAKAKFSGYEIHLGQTHGEALNHPAMLTSLGSHGALSPDGQILGTYVHGVFDQNESMQALLNWAGLNSNDSLDYMAIRDMNINRVAKCIEQHLNIDYLLTIIKNDSAHQQS